MLRKDKDIYTHKITDAALTALTELSFTVSASSHGTPSNLFLMYQW